jgi:hypothetical protein
MNVERNPDSFSKHVDIGRLLDESGFRFISTLFSRTPLASKVGTLPAGITVGIWESPLVVLR